MQLSQFYVPCDDSNLPILALEWAGFHTNTQVLAENGWLVKCLYNRFIKRYMLRFYNPAIYMTFALKFKLLSELEDPTLVREIKFVSTGGGRPQKGIFRAEYIHELASKDIPPLLQIIVDLQKPSRKRQIHAAELPEAEVIKLMTEV